jgi:hypothetical protein
MVTKYAAVQNKVRKRNTKGRINVFIVPNSMVRSPSMKLPAQENVEEQC